MAEGDEAAFTLLFNAYHQRLGAYIFRLTQSAPLTQEIVQDVFVKIWLKRAAMIEVADFKAYLFTATRNQVFNHLKKIARERTRQADWETTLITQAATDPLPDSCGDASGSADIYAAWLDQAVERLPPQQRKVYLLHRRQGLSHAEIARQLHLSVETVKKHMSLALRAIRDYATVLPEK